MRFQTKYVIGAVLVVFVILAAYFFYTDRDRFESVSQRKGPIIGPSGPVNIVPDMKQGFLPYEQLPWFQGLPPSATMENRYHKIIADECGGDYTNYECRQKAYIKTLKDGTFDKADLICWNHRNNEDAYYKCLDSIYGNYVWMDRDVGTDPCLCFDGSTGALGADRTCHCPPPRPLNDRRPLDQDYKVVNTI